MAEKSMQFANKNIVVIGGSSGLGLSIANGFLKQGANVIISGRTRKKLQLAAKQFSFPGIQMDVSSYSSVQNGLKKIAGFFSTIHVVICSAGIHLKKPVSEMTPLLWKKIMDVNLNGTFYVNLVFGKKMLAQNEGVLINISSLGARVALSEAAAYNVSKSGVEMLTKCLACEWAGQGVRVNAILPGVFKTSLNQKALSDKKRSSDILAKTPMKRFGKLKEIVSSALFLASDEASYITGTSVVVDGGFLAYSGF